MEELTYTLKTGGDLPPEQLEALYSSVGWEAYLKDGVGSLLKAIENSTFVVSAWYQKRLVGLARVMSDEVSIFYLQDILVDPAFQGQGIGSRLMKHCLARFDHVRMGVLMTDDREDQGRFYRRFGFIRSGEGAGSSLNAFVRFGMFSGS
jgi:ribosomal protein S18 acetylase RimI-like enzyme